MEEFHAPRFQSCPECGARVRRQSKGRAGASFRHFCKKVNGVVRWNCRVVAVEHTEAPIETVSPPTGRA